MWQGGVSSASTSASNAAYSAAVHFRRRSTPARISTSAIRPSFVSEALWPFFR